MKEGILKITNGEVVPQNFLPRGEMRTIAAETAFYEHYHKNPLALEEDLQPLSQATSEGYSYVLSLPRVNERECVKKYGPMYDKLTIYTDFVRTLAARNGITKFKIIRGIQGLFANKADAELLRDKLIEQQKEAKLEFEIVDNTPNSPDT